MAKNVVINNVQYNNVPFIDVDQVGGGTAYFYELSDATGTAADLLTGKTAYLSTGIANGSMANNGDTSGTISTKDGTVTIPEGYTSGGTVGLSSSAKNAIVSTNIKSGRSILGVSGNAMILDTTISSSAATAANILSGYKAYVNGALVTGSATVPTITQDSSTHGLSIR